MYTTLADLKAYLNITVTTYDSQLTALIMAVSDAIDNYCDRWFQARTLTRYYTDDDLGQIPGEVSNDRPVLYLGEDLLTVTTLTNGDSTTIAPANYWLYPRNSSPKLYIRLKSGYSWLFDTDGEISVAGTWGYSATPPLPVERACMLWAAQSWLTKGTEGYKSEQIGDYSYTLDGTSTGAPMALGDPPVLARDLLNPYRVLRG